MTEYCTKILELGFKPLRPRGKIEPIKPPELEVKIERYELRAIEFDAYAVYIISARIGKISAQKEGEEFAKNNNVLFFETSAKDYDSVENVFLTLSEEYIKNQEKEKKPFENIVDSNISSVNGNVNDKDIEIDPSCSSSKCFLF